MNINSPIFVPQAAPIAAAATNAAVMIDPLSPFGSPTKMGQWFNFVASASSDNMSYYQQPRLRQQQLNYFNQQQQRNFFNTNYQYQWASMSTTTTHKQQTRTQQQQQQQQQQQKPAVKQQQQKQKYAKPNVAALPAAATIPTLTTATKLVQKASHSMDASATLDSTATTTATTNTDIQSVTCEAEEAVETKQNDTMQRNGSKASHNTKSHKDSQQHQHNHHHHHHQHHQSNSKNDSSDSGVSTTGQHQHHQHAPHHHHQQSQNAKQRKSRSSSKRQDAHLSAQKRAAAGFSMDVWLGREMVYCYDRRFMASCAEDNLLPRHNNKHRNSTSSDAAASDDLNSSSSNEDLSTAYAVVAKASKKSVKSRQRRQQKRKQQTGQHSGNNDNSIPTHAEQTTPMDIDEESKENRLPTNSKCTDAQSQNNVAGKGAGLNLRKQCTKAAALKAVNKHNSNSNNNNSHSNKGADGKCSANANTLSTSASNSSVCSTLSSASSSLSISSSDSSSPTSSAHCSPTGSPTASKRNSDIKKAANALVSPLRQSVKMNMSEHELVEHLRRYIIDPNLLRVYGFPVESAVHEGCIEIYKCLPKAFTTHVQHHAKVQAQKQKPPKRSKSRRSGSYNHTDGLEDNLNNQWPDNEDNENEQNGTPDDSGQSSGTSSPPSMDSDSSEGAEDEPTGTTAVYTPDGSYQVFSHYEQSVEKQCSRCTRTFHVTASGEYLNHEECTFHWGKLFSTYHSINGFIKKYTCCSREKNSEGCSRNSLHVWSGAVVGLNGPYTDFVHTCPRQFTHTHRHSKIYALDCEMSFTGCGLEVTKVTVVNYKGELVYEHFVRPQAEIVDYNTRFSGVTESDLYQNSNTYVKTLPEVQYDLMRLFTADTILIGHGLDNDLRVLRIVHKTVIDTSVVFPHEAGFPYRRSLKQLAKLCLKTDIQTGNMGHSSYEDSRSCLELMLWKVRMELLQGYQQQLLQQQQPQRVVYYH